MLQAEINFGIIGLGHIGKRHAEMIQRHPEANLTAICDITTPESFGQEFPSVPYYNTLDEMLQQHKELDAVVVATPNGLHAEHSLKCLDAQKHVVVEKPMTLTKADAEKVIYKALNVHKQLFVVMQNRYSPPNIWLKELIEGGKLGRIFMVQINCYWNRDARYYTGDNWHGSKDLDGGTLFTQFSHFIDIMYWLFGDIANIEGRLADFNHKDLTAFEDSGVVSFEFVNGGMGSINYSTSVYEQNLESSMTIIAENGSVKVGGQYMDKVEACNIKDYQMPKLAPTNPGNDYGVYKGSAANHSYIIENVVSVLKGRASITTNALEGLKVVDIIEKIYRKSKSL